MNTNLNKAIRYEILESKASKLIPANYIIGNLKTGVKRSGKFIISAKQKDIVVSAISHELMRQKGMGLWKEL